MFHLIHRQMPISIASPQYRDGRDLRSMVETMSRSSTHSFNGNHVSAMIAAHWTHPNWQRETERFNVVRRHRVTLSTIPARQTVNWVNNQAKIWLPMAKTSEAYVEACHRLWIKQTRIDQRTGPLWDNATKVKWIAKLTPVLVSRNTPSGKTWSSYELRGVMKWCWFRIRWKRRS